MTKKMSYKFYFVSICVLAVFLASFFAAIMNINTNGNKALSEGIKTITQDVNPIFTDYSRYMTLSEPSVLAFGGGTFVALDGDKIITKKSDNSPVTSNIETRKDMIYGFSERRGQTAVINGLSDGIRADNVVDMCVFDKYVFILYVYEDITKLDIFDIDGGRLLTFSKNPFDLSVVGGVDEKLPISITIDDRGYLCAVYNEDKNIYGFRLSTENGELAVGVKNIINTAAQGFDLKLTFSNGEGDAKGELFLLNAALVGQNIKKRIRRVDLSNNQESPFLDINEFAAQNEVKLAATGKYLVLSNGKSVMCVQKADVTKKGFTKTLSPLGMVTNGDNILFSMKGVSSVGEYEITDGDFKKISDYGNKGSAEKLLNAPISVCSYRNYYFIADAGNNRIVRYEMGNGAVVKGVKILDLSTKMTTLSSLAVDNNGIIYCGDAGGKITLWATDFTEKGSYNIESGNGADKLVFDAENNLYVLSVATHRVYKKNHNSATFEKIYDSVKSVSDIGVSYLGNILYLVVEDNTEKKIITIDLLKNEEKLDFSVGLSEYSIVKTIALEVDKKGNIALCATVSTGATKVFFIERKQTKYTPEREVTLTDGNTQIDFSAPSDFVIMTNGDMLTVNGKANLLGFISNKTNTGETVLPFSATIDSDFVDPSETVYFDVIRIVEDCYAYIKPNNFENVLKISESSLFVTLSDVVVNEGNSYYYIKSGNYKCYLPIKYAEKMAMTAAPYAKGTVKHRNVKIYSKPIASDSYLVYNIDDKKAIIDIENTLGYLSEEINIGFVKVTYGTYKGYAERGRISKYTSIEYGTTVQNYMKIKVSSVGAKVPLYKNADNASEVLVMLADGDKVSLLEPYSSDKEFILVSANGIAGYVDCSALFKNGLSTSQIIAISLVSGVIVFGIALFFIARAIRKKNYENYSDEDLNNGYYDDNDLYE